MNKNDIKIRLERKEELRTVENLVREAFLEYIPPGCLEHYVLHKMRNHPDFIPELNYALEKDGRVEGQNVFVEQSFGQTTIGIFQLQQWIRSALRRRLSDKATERSCWTTRRCRCNILPLQRAEERLSWRNF